MSQITTHILDTSKGKPAKGITITLQQKNGTRWKKVGQGVTDDDGRIGDLLADDKVLPAGLYRMIFETGPYFAKQKKKTFYPEVTILFETFDSKHYHVPLLLNPFGYSTYRGS